MAVLGGCSASRQWRQAERIDAAPVRVTGVVTAVEHVPKSGYEQVIAYEVQGRRHTVRRSLGAGTGSPGVGHRVCLEADRDRPDVVRLCGERHPSGDDLYPTYVLVTVAGAIGACVVAGVANGVRRSRSKPSR
ncbi:MULTISPECIES: hypothetical protein [unclassified Streptomyces]|uniref:hypothetical protein n=1 Tax=unclassified Streptomyces TaxID=2593676 RepID=UPI002E17EF6B|nr:MULTISPECIES: hypothetical protein [unclassified Streptomyces]